MNSSKVENPTIKSHLAFTLASGLALLVIYSLLRVALLVYDRELIGDTAVAEFIEAFYNGMRFDLRVLVCALAPLLLALLVFARWLRAAHCAGSCTGFASLTLLLGITELDFYREFHQRLNNLLFQYFEEDLYTVASMLWNGFPVARYLLAWAVSPGCWPNCSRRWICARARRSHRPRPPVRFGTRALRPFSSACW